MNIIIAESGTGHGGSTSYLYSFLKYLDRPKFNPTVIFYNFTQGYHANQIRELGVEIIFLNNKQKTADKIPGALHMDSFDLATKVLGHLSFLYKFATRDILDTIRIVNLIKQRNARLVMLNNEVNLHIAGILAAKLAGVPCVVRKSGTGTLRGNKIRRVLSALVDVFLASSNAEYRGHIEKRLPFKKMLTIYEGVDLNAYYPALLNNKLRSELGIQPEQHIVGSVSRLEAGKGHSDFIKAASLVIKTLPQTFFVIVGDDVDSAEGHMRKALQQQVDQLGIKDNIIFTGWRNDILDILQGIDLFVHCPDRWLEGLGIATLEAEACGKPVIVSNNWGLVETTIDGYNGFIVKPGDEAGLAEKIKILLTDNQKLKEMGSNSRKLAEEKFDILKNVKETEKILLETALKTKGAQA